MKKDYKIVSILMALILCLQFSCFTFVSANKIYPADIPYKPPKQSREELYQDIFMTLLLPSLQNTVDNYYKEYLTVTPTVAPYDVTILKVDRLGENGTFDFRLKLELHPYVGPHLDVGLDYITIRVNPMDKVKIEKFEHIKSYELPSHYQNIIKKKLP